VQPTTRQLQMTDGTAIAVDYYAAGRDRLIVLCPGFLQERKSPRFRELAGVLSEHFDVAILDFRGTGDSSGHFTYGAAEPDDLHAVLADAKTQWGAIGVVGCSLGAATAIVELARHHDAQSLVAVSAPMAFEEIENRWWTWRSLTAGWHNAGRWWRFRSGGLWWPKVAPQDIVDQLAPIPVLFIHGTNDPIVYPRHSERLYALAREPKRLELIPGGTHAEELWRHFPQQCLPLVVEWFQQTL